MKHVGLNANPNYICIKYFTKMLMRTTNYLSLFVLIVNVFKPVFNGHSQSNVDHLDPGDKTMAK